MKRLVLFLFCTSVAYAQNHEILRPTMDVNSSSTAIGCSGSNGGTSPMPNGHDAAGLSTSDSNTAQGSITSTIYKVRIFNTWATPTNAYTTLSLKVNSSGVETFFSGGTGTIHAAYSLDGGSTWVQFESNTWSQHTDTIALSTAQDFTKLQVAVCVQSNAGGDAKGDIETVTVWDIWTDGTYTSGAVGNGSSQGVPAIQPIMISEFVENKEKAWHTLS